ncbi:MAG: winged helix DNA-binding domain-containing protein, partial [Clostridiales bacterium]|nr:winged helix DNA-binding domain-containing protein [Clostridiales bacterium]
IGSAFHGWGGLFYECNRRGFTGSLPGTAKRYFIMNAELVETEAARREIMKRYFTHYGPASIDDFLAFTGHKKTEVKELLKEKVLEMTEVECEGKKLYVQGEMPENGKIPKCLFLAGFDQMIMGYKDRTSILRDEWKRSLITVSGIVLPPLMLDGNIVGRWKKDKKVMEVLLFGKIGKAKVQLIERSVSKEFPDVEKCLVHEQI